MNRGVRVLGRVGREVVIIGGTAVLRRRRLGLLWARRHLSLRIEPAEPVGAPLAPPPGPAVRDVRLRLSWSRGRLRGTPLESR